MAASGVDVILGRGTIHSYGGGCKSQVKDVGSYEQYLRLGASPWTLDNCGLY